MTCNDIRMKLKILQIELDACNQEVVFEKITELEKLVGIDIVHEYLTSLIATDNIIIRMEACDSGV